MRDFVMRPEGETKAEADMKGIERRWILYTLGSARSAEFL